MSSNRPLSPLLYCFIVTVCLSPLTVSEPKVLEGESSTTGNSPKLQPVADQVHDEYPPSIREPKVPRQMFIGKEDKNIQVKCQAQGMPKPLISWYRDGTLVTTKEYYGVRIHSDGTLEFQSFFSQYNGFYQCKARNKLGTSLSQLVHIQADRLSKANTNSDDDKFEVTEGDPFSLPCDNVPTTARQMIKRWYDSDRNNNELGLSARVGTDLNGTLHFAYTTKEDSRKYACGVLPGAQSKVDELRIHLFPRGEVKVNDREDLTQSVLAKPTVAFSTSYVKAFMGRKAVIQCFFSANPTAKISWKNSSNHEVKGGPNSRFTVEDYGRQLVIDPVMQVDEGRFVCTGSNDYGFYRSYIIVNVTTPPLSVPGGVLTSQIKPSNQNTHLICKTSVAAGESSDKPRWFRNGLPFSQTNVPSARYRFSNDYTELHIEKLHKTIDTANFQCNTSNSEGYMFYDAYLRVIDALVITKKPANVSEIKHGDVVDISIRASGDVCCPINKLWLHNDTVIPDIQKFTPFQLDALTGTLLFNSSRVPKDELTTWYGRYTCRVSNERQDIAVIFRILPKASEAAPARNDPETKEASMEIWWIGLVAGLALIVIVVIVVVLIYKSRYPGSTYKLEEQEIKHNLNPEEDLLNQSFHEI